MRVDVSNRGVLMQMKRRAAARQSLIALISAPLCAVQKDSPPCARAQRAHTSH